MSSRNQISKAFAVLAPLFAMGACGVPSQPAVSVTTAALTSGGSHPALGSPPSGGCSPMHVTLQGGQPMMGDDPSNIVTIVPVAWGPLAQLGYQGAFIDAFLGNVFQGVSPWYFWIKAQYHLPNIATTPMKALTLTAANATKTTVTHADIEAEISAHLADGTLPTSTGSLHSVSSMLYVLHFPASVTVNADGVHNLCAGGGGGICAYNTNEATFTFVDGRSIHYAVIPDITSPSCSTCQGGIAAADGMTMVESHELIEALSGPMGGWFDSAGREPCAQIADMCTNQPILTQINPSRQATVQAVWSNVANRCAGNYGGAPGDLLGQGTSAVVLAGDTDPGTGVSAVHYAQAVPGQLTNTALSAHDLSVNPVWMTWQKTGRELIGDLDGNGIADLVLSGVDATTFAVAMNSFGATGTVTSGTFVTDGVPASLAGKVGADFRTFATQTLIPPVAGDFNGDGLADIALVGGKGWSQIPIAFSTGRQANDLTQTFWATAQSDGGLNGYVASNVGTPQLVAADFNGDGLTDLALVGLTSGQNVGKNFIVVAYSLGDPAHGYSGNATFSLKEVALAPPSGNTAADFNKWASMPSVKALAGDFDGDGFGDIVLTGGQGWASVPMAFTRGATGPNVNFSFVNLSTGTDAGDNATIATQASTNYTQAVAGDFDGNGVWDLALTGPSGWNYVGLGISPTVVGSGDTFGGLYWDQNVLADFAATAAKPNVYALSVSHGGLFFFSKADIQINAGGPAAAPFVADVDFSGGATKIRNVSIDVSGVVNPAPVSVYQSQRYNNHSYTIPGFTAGSTHNVRLHWAETHWTGPNQRKFNVTINGTKVLSSFDVFAAAGAANKAVIKEFALPADSSGRFVISFVGTLDAAFISGIEVQ